MDSTPISSHGIATNKRRLRNSCDCCTRSKLKCDQMKPSCNRCVRRSQDCVYNQKCGWLPIYDTHTPNNKDLLNIEKTDPEPASDLGLQLVLMNQAMQDQLEHQLVQPIHMSTPDALQSPELSYPHRSLEIDQLVVSESGIMTHLELFGNEKGPEGSETSSRESKDDLNYSACNGRYLKAYHPAIHTTRVNGVNSTLQIGDLAMEDVSNLCIDELLKSRLGRVVRTVDGMDGVARKKSDEERTYVEI
ncbi:zn 2cys6 transcription [Colletotrichum incanum]|uniref:Zn 2cys6 transcription n=1 Tax=Colletotrichum incanum TaxID=1573173 RepID=A0A161VCQ1_COLIC|nr:zn 2cys6 transcription [Colletotrichum incanum]